MSQRCQARVIRGFQCKRNAPVGEKYCFQHKPNTVVNMNKKLIETLDCKDKPNYLPRLPADLREELTQYLPIRETELLFSYFEEFFILGKRDTFMKSLYKKKFSPIIPTGKTCEAHHLLSWREKTIRELYWENRRILEEYTGRSEDLSQLLYQAIEKNWTMLLPDIVKSCQKNNIVLQSHNTYRMIENSRLDGIKLVSPLIRDNMDKELMLKHAAMCNQPEIVHYLTSQGVRPNFLTAEERQQFHI